MKKFLFANSKINLKSLSLFVKKPLLTISGSNKNVLFKPNIINYFIKEEKINLPNLPNVNLLFNFFLELSGALTNEPKEYLKYYFQN